MSHRKPGFNTVPGTNRSSNSTRGRIKEEHMHMCLSIRLHGNALVPSDCCVMQFSINDKRPEKKINLTEIMAYYSSQFWI